jgi:hypothetical protein
MRLAASLPTIIGGFAYVILSIVGTALSMVAILKVSYLVSVILAAAVVFAYIFWGGMVFSSDEKAGKGAKEGPSAQSDGDVLPRGHEAQDLRPVGVVGKKVRRNARQGTFPGRQCVCNVVVMGRCHLGNFFAQKRANFDHGFLLKSCSSCAFFAQVFPNGKAPCETSSGTWPLV